ncbi:hypothetical protein IDH44_15020 [Paenibacillus sp. IB182496]|uniref:Uncharacterized protein n=1 Tax=Paenibacillus sabuli TaxID=2772509 RepID=A0A927GTA4_9BACL|nr:hypothetical protein [Paenibacillus sabuli]MBD2846512.1 hypothetical protein [Paenibacillus sabuli]
MRKKRPSPSDGTHTVTSETRQIAVTGGRDRSDLRLNVRDGDILSGTQLLKGTSEHAPWHELTLALDGAPLAQDTYAALESDAYFAFEATSVNYYFKNGVTIDEECSYNC